jgi:hypothetical protein
MNIAHAPNLLWMQIIFPAFGRTKKSPSDDGLF